VPDQDIMSRDACRGSEKRRGFASVQELAGMSMLQMSVDPILRIVVLAGRVVRARQSSAEDVRDERVGERW
jgi:hypothetical protein